jgi:purine-nucleoside phosphorylase
MKAASILLAAKLGGLAPRFGIVLGSGLGGWSTQVEDARPHSYADLPGFPVSGVTGHAGEVVAG